MLRAMRRSWPVFLILVSCSEKRPPPAPAAPPKPAAPAPAAPAAAPADLADEGTLRITRFGRPAGEETFRIVPTAAGREIVTRTVLRGAGGEVTVDGKLVVDADHEPQSGTFTVTAKEGKREEKLERKDGKLQLVTAGAEPLVDSGRSDLFIENLVVSHLAPLCALSGTAEKQLAIFPGTRLTVSARAPLEFDLERGKRTLDVLAFHVPGAAVVELACDGKKLAIVRQPSVGVVTTRVGYEEMAAVLAEAENRKPRLPAGVEELDRQVGSPVAGGAQLDCSLMLPAERKSPLPGVVLTNLQGPHDRDGDTVGAGGIKVALLKHVAIALALSGVASLRCDDRGVGHSGGSMNGMSLGALAADVAVQVAVLRAEAGLDPKRVGIVGHGEGATLAQLVAAQDPGIPAIGLLAPMGRTLDQITLDQRAAEMRRVGAKDADVRAERKKMAQLFAAIRTGKPPPKGTPNEMVTELAPIVPYLAGHFRHDLAGTARKVKASVLIAHGEKDALIPVSDARRLRGLYAKAGHRKVTFRTYPGLNHIFTPVKRDTVEDFADPELAVDMAFVGDLVMFLKSAL
jgi:dienelactone hydrolase